MKLFPIPFSYDEGRMATMASTCDREFSNSRWWPIDEEGEDVRRQHQYEQCYPSLEHSTPARRKNVFGNWVTAVPRPNVGLYGRYCGGGHPDADWWTLANEPHYQPIDPIDALCTEHDVSEDHHEIPASEVGRAACVVRYGIESEELHYEGLRVPEGSDRWNEFWDRWPDMAAARTNWIVETSVCAGPIYDEFLAERELSRP